MKFLCVDCDESMALVETSGPDRGSMKVLFQCRNCNREIAMLTNAMETQMVQSLGVKVGPGDGSNGGVAEPVAPMSTIRSSLKGFGGEESVVGTAGESKCPFTGMIEAQVENQVPSDGPAWTPEAEARMAQIPSFIRPMVQKGIEDHARTNKCPVIDDKVIDSVRNSMGM
jgi:Proto-chlorophyllide reductase 57 kD subunit